MYTVPATFWTLISTLLKSCASETDATNRNIPSSFLISFPSRLKCVRHCTVATVHEIIVYSRKQCHLCDEVKEKLQRLASRAQFQWREIDIDSDPELQRLYNDEVPVVFVNGRKAFKYTLDEQEFLKKLEARG
jgi:glutaredoxin